MVELYSFPSEQLSYQGRYDFGMCAVCLSLMTKAVRLAGQSGAVTFAKVKGPSPV